GGPHAHTDGDAARYPPLDRQRRRTPTSPLDRGPGAGNVVPLPDERTRSGAIAAGDGRGVVRPAVADRGRLRRDQAPVGAGVFLGGLGKRRPTPGVGDVAVVCGAGGHDRRDRGGAAATVRGPL